MNKTTTQKRFRQVRKKKSLFNTKLAARKPHELRTFLREFISPLEKKVLFDIIEKVMYYRGWYCASQTTIGYNNGVSRETTNRVLALLYHYGFISWDSPDKWAGHETCLYSFNDLFTLPDWAFVLHREGCSRPFQKYVHNRSRNTNRINHTRDIYTAFTGDRGWSNQSSVAQERSGERPSLQQSKDFGVLLDSIWPSIAALAPLSQKKEQEIVNLRSSGQGHYLQRPHCVQCVSHSNDIMLKPETGMRVRCCTQTDIWVYDTSELLSGPHVTESELYLEWLFAGHDYPDQNYSGDAQGVH